MVQRAGQLRHYAELQSKNEVPDGAGGTTVTWVKSRNIWCRIQPISGVQQMESMRRNSTISHEITARYRDDITTEKRIVHRGTAYNIEAVTTPEEKEVEAHIIASSGVPT